MNQKERDQNLFQQIKSDDEFAFKKLFDIYYKQLCYSAYKVYQDEHKAKDFVQEVFLDLWKRRAVINIQSSLHAFLRRAVTNKAIDFIRSQRLNFEETPINETDQIIEDSPTEFTELKDLIHHTVGQLPERCRIIFSMSRFEEMSHKEIAAKLNISEKTIENQITKALKILRKVVQNYGTRVKLFLIYFLFG